MFAPKTVAESVSAEEYCGVGVLGLELVMHLQRCSHKITYLGTS
jgi:hypothetical protein